MLQGSILCMQGLFRATTFVWSIIKVRAASFYAIPQRCHCVVAVMLAIVLRAQPRSAFLLDAVGSP